MVNAEGWVVPVPTTRRTGSALRVVARGPAGLDAAAQVNVEGNTVEGLGAPTASEGSYVRNSRTSSSEKGSSESLVWFGLQLQQKMRGRMAVVFRTSSRAAARSVRPYRERVSVEEYRSSKRRRQCVLAGGATWGDGISPSRGASLNGITLAIYGLPAAAEQAGRRRRRE